MFIEAFKITFLGITQIFILGVLGYFLVKRNFLREEGLNILSRLIIEVTLPLLIFSQLVKDFRFKIYPQWWIFPLISIAITFLGLFIGFIFLWLIKEKEAKRQFLSLVAFQNSGYLPLALIATLLAKDKAEIMFIYLFLYLLGFNLLIWSFGVHLLTFSRVKKFELASFFSPPVIATIFSLIFIFLGLNRFFPPEFLRPLRMIGDCTLPLAMLVVGGNLAQIKLQSKINKKAILLIVLIKLIILPTLGLILVKNFKLAELLGLLIIMQLAMPPATSLSIILRHYKKEDLIISQGIFFGHILSLISIPLFLSLYFMLIK